MFWWRVESSRWRDGFWAAMGIRELETQRSRSRDGRLQSMDYKFAFSILGETQIIFFIDSMTALILSFIFISCTSRTEKTQPIKS